MPRGNLPHQQLNEFKVRFKKASQRGTGSRYFPTTHFLLPPLIRIYLFINYPTLEKFKQETTKPAIYSVPDISSELSNMRLFARYAVQKNFFLHLDYILNRFKTNE
ncbi:hypothetical protein [Nitrosomonas sp.]|uniref:hypothetical protein n=1 Tax=Nitrosomonas sp. TaxID=42353 RepID=UPI0035B02BCD